MSARLCFVILVAMSVLLACGEAHAVLLQNPTAIYSQGGWPVGNSIDGVLSTGWANAGNNVDNTACYEFAEDVGHPFGVRLTVDLDQYYTNSLHNLGRFRLSVTADDRHSLTASRPAGT